jgi:Glutaminase
MKTLLFSTLVLFTFSLPGSTGKIKEIIHGKYSSHLRILKFQDGTVAYMENGKKLDSMKLVGEWVSFKTDRQFSLKDIQITPRPLSKDYDPTFETKTAIYHPTVLLNYSVAQKVMDEFRRPWAQGAQCYDRAHVWAFEENKKYGTNLMKAFLFFSDDYIERYRFPWWFHVAPYANLKMNNELTERILDPAFAKYPLKFKLWTDLFMKNKVECASIERYSDYSAGTVTSDCFIHRATMHYWQPKDLEALEDYDSEKNGFFDEEVQWAYDNGFKI